MLVKPALLGPISGKMGGTVASHNAGGTYLRRLSVPTDPSSARQLTIRAAVAELANRWSNVISSAQRAAWDLYGANTEGLKNRLGDGIKLSGISHYIRANTIRVQFGLTIIDAAPVNFTLGDVPIITNTVVDSSSNNVQITVPGASNPWIGDDETQIFAWLSGGQNPAINFYKGPYRKIGAALSATTSALAFTNSASGHAITTGVQYFVSLRTQSPDGRLSPATQVRAIAQA